MKRLFSLITAGILLLSLVLPASAGSITDITEDVDKQIATGVTVGTQTFTVSATFTPAGPGAEIGEGIGFYYQNGEGTPPQSFYRFVVWRDNGSDAGSDRVDFYCEKQYNDKNVGNVPASINGVAADDPAINEEYRYISVDWGWYAASEVAFKMDVTVDPEKQQATAVLTGIPSGNRAVLVVDLTQKARGEKTAGELTSGEVFVWKTKCGYSNFQIEGADTMSTVAPPTEPSIPPTETLPTGENTVPIVEPPTTMRAPENPQDVAVSGILQDETGSALPGKLLIVDQSNGEQVNTLTDENGRFRFPNIPEGMTTLTVRDDQGNVQAATQFWLEAGDTAAVSEDGSRVTAGENGVGLTLMMNAAAYEIALSLNAGEAPSATTTGRGGGSEEQDVSPVLWIVLGAVALAVVVGVAAVVLLRKKRAASAPAGQPDEKAQDDSADTP